MKLLEKVYKKMNVKATIIFASAMTFFCIVSMVFDIAYYCPAIIKSLHPLTWLNSWMPCLAVEMFVTFFVGLLINSWFYNKKWVTSSLTFLSYIFGGIFFAAILSVIILGMLSAKSNHYWNLLILTPIIGGWMGIIFWFIINSQSIKHKEV